MQKRLMKKLLLAGAVLFCGTTILGKGTYVEAAKVEKEQEDNDSFKSANMIKSNRTIKGRMNSKNDKDFYKYKVDKKGYFTIHFDSQEDPDDYWYGWKWCVYDQDHNEIYKQTSVKSQDESKTFDFKPGTVVYVSVEAQYNQEDMVNKVYRLSVEAKESNDWEVENNDSAKNATTLKAKKKKYATMYTRKDVDFFKYKVAEKSIFKIALKNEAGSDDCGWGWKVTIYDEDMNEITTDELKTEYESQVFSFKKDTVIYIKVAAKYSDNDVVDLPYSVTIKTKADPNWEIEKNDSAKKATKISQGFKKLGNLITDKDVDYYVVKASQKGEMKLKFELDEHNSCYGWNICVYDKNQKELASKNGVTSSTKLSWNAKTGESYYIVISSKYRNDNTAAIQYSISIK